MDALAKATVRRPGGQSGSGVRWGAFGKEGPQVREGTRRPGADQCRIGKGRFGAQEPAWEQSKRKSGCPRNGERVREQNRRPVCPELG